MRDANAGGNENTETSSTEYVGRGTTRRRKTSRRILIEALAEKDGWVCGVCHKELGDGNVHLDHKVAISTGGEDSLQNLQLAHVSCNQQKGNGRKREYRSALPRVLPKGTNLGGRPRVYETNAERQRAYRNRKEEGGEKGEWKKDEEQ